MKIKIIKSVWVDSQKDWEYDTVDKWLLEGEVIDAVSISKCGKYANIILEGYSLLDVPVDAFVELSSP